MKTLKALFTISGNLTVREQQVLTETILLLNRHFKLDLEIISDSEDLTAQDWHQQIIKNFNLQLNGVNSHK